MKNKFIITLSLAVALSSSTAHAFTEKSNFSFGNRLIDAVEQNNVEIVEAILSNGEDPNATGKFDTSPLHRAAFHGNTQMVQLLVKNGADVNIRDYGGASPLHLAARNGSGDAATELLNDGADLNAVDSQGFTPLHRAITNNQTPISMMLIAKGADVNTVNNEGDTPLIDAVKVSNPTLVKELIIKGADRNIKNNKGLDAIDYALKTGNKKIDTLLARSVQDLMKENPVSQNIVTVAHNDSAAKAVPAFLQQEAEMQNQIADAAPLVSQGTGNEYLEAIKVPVADVQEEIIQPVKVQEAEATPAEQVKERFQFADIQQKRIDAMPMLVPDESEANLEKAPRMPDDGQLPKSLRSDFRKIAAKQAADEKAQKDLAIAQKNMKPIELPKEEKDIERSSNFITLPKEETMETAVKDVPPLAQPKEEVKAEPTYAENFAELPVPVEDGIKVERKAELQVPAESPTPNFIQLEAEQNARAAEQVQFAQAKTNFIQLEPATDVPANNNLPASMKPHAEVAAPVAVAPQNLNNSAPTTPVDSMQVIKGAPSAPIDVTPAAPVAITAPAPIMQMPAQNPVIPDADYMLAVDQVMNEYASNPAIDKGYESEVDALMAQATGSAPAAPGTQSTYTPPAYPASLAMKNAVTSNMGLSQDANNYIAQNIQPTNYTAQPISNASRQTIENVMPQVVTPEVQNDHIAMPAPEAPMQPVMKRSSNVSYDTYRANLMNDINEFYNNDSRDTNHYDISDLERQRMSNLGLSNDSIMKQPVPAAPAKASQPASETKGMTNEDMFPDIDSERKASYDNSDVMAVPETKVQVDDMEKLDLPEENPVEENKADLKKSEEIKQEVIDTKIKEQEQKAKEETEEKPAADSEKDIDIDLEAPELQAVPASNKN